MQLSAIRIVFTIMKRYQVTARFEWNETVASLVEAHRTYINYLINKGTIEQYAVSMDSMRVWITIYADDREDVQKALEQSPLYPHWTSLEMDELIVLDGQQYRFPAVQLN